MSQDEITEDQHKQDDAGREVEASTTAAPGSFAAAAPQQVVEPENALPEMTLDDLPENLRLEANKAGWSSLTPVQSKAIPYMLADRDIMVQSRTGSGKTGAFLLPILSRIDTTHPYCQALVLVPTRELALQVVKEAEKLAVGSDVNVVAVYGGVGYGPQLEGFKKGAHLVVGTPGRVLDHLVKRSLDLEDLEILVFDEADRMMSMGFYPDMRQIKSHLPRNRSSYMFSATFPSIVLNLAREFLHEPEFLSLSHGAVHVSNMDHLFYEVDAMQKDRALVRIIEMENPSSAIIFCNTKHKVSYVTTVLQRFGYDADELTADLSQKARERVLERIRQGTLRFLVATDVAARGIDIAHLSHVILYEFPDDQESYIHRAGRTGRAGAAGVCISLVSFMEIGEMERTAKRYSIEMERREVPSDENVQAIVAERAVAMLEQKLRGRDRVETERMQRFLPLAKALSESEDELPVIAMLLDEYYQTTLHAPVAQPEGDAMTAEKRRNLGGMKPDSGQGQSRGGKPGGGGGRREGSGGPGGGGGGKGRPRRRRGGGGDRKG